MVRVENCRFLYIAPCQIALHPSKYEVSTSTLISVLALPPWLFPSSRSASVVILNSFALFFQAFQPTNFRE